MKRKQLYILTLLLMVTQGAWAQSTAYVSTYAELSDAVSNASVNNIIVTADINVPCMTSVTSTANPDLSGSSTARLVINRSLTLQSQSGSKYTIKRIAANGATTDRLKSLISIRGDGNGTSGKANLTENKVEVTFTNIIIDGGADWGSSTVPDRRTAATTAYGNAGRAMIDVFMGGTLNLEDGTVLQNGFTTYSINSVVNNSGSNNYGGAVRVEYHANYGGGTVNLKAGATIHDCSAQGGNTAGYGGALGAYNFARLNVYGGTIYNCSAANGGAIGCTWRSSSDHKTSGTINLFGGTIRDCYANKGGAILTEGTVEDYLLGGTISDCTAATEGGAIAIPEKDTQVHIVDHSSGWLTFNDCSPDVAGTASTGYYPFVSMHAEATISTTPVYQVTFINNNSEFTVLHVLQGNSLGEAFPAAPVNADLRFLGWYNGNTQVTSSTAITENITVTAKWDFLGSGTVENPYLIPSAEAWNLLADKVNNGTNYSGKFFRQTEDISVSTMVGTTSSHKFSGTYDGDGHTLTVNYNSTAQYAAPFSYADGATFKNLHIAGSITSSAKYVASFVGYSYGSNTFLNCRSSVAITSSISGDGTHGGFVGILEGDNASDYTVTFEGCVFNGKLLGSNTTNCGGFVGWSQTHRKIRINLTNCLYAPQEVTISISGCQTFSRGQVLSDIFSTNTNNYYIESLGGTQGKQARSITAGDDVTISGLGAASATYDVSGITAYAHGIKFGGTYYAGSGDAVSLNLSHGNKAGSTFSHYAVTGGGSLSAQTETSATLTMTDANQVINVRWKQTLNQATDNSTFISGNNGNIYDITLTRTLQAGGWNTFCVPFNISSAQIESIFGEGTKVRELGNSNFNSTTKQLTLNFTNTSEIEAGKPYLVYLGSASNVVNPTFYDVTIADGTTPTTTTYANFVPVMNPTSLTGGDKTVLFVTGGNKLTYPNATGDLKGFRAYFQLKGDAAANARSFAMSFDDETTAIASMSDVRGKMEDVYTIDGRKLDKQPTQKGVYIINGRKVVIK